MARRGEKRTGTYGFQDDGVYMGKRKVGFVFMRGLISESR